MGLRLTFSRFGDSSHEEDDCENERGEFGGGRGLDYVMFRDISRPSGFGWRGTWLWLASMPHVLAFATTQSNEN
jgi:hypothetical protein